MPYSEDYDLFWKIGRDYKITNLDEALVDYRLSPTSLNTVLRKDEYAEANRANVLRNIRYYVGETFEIREEYLECLRHNFGPLLRLNDIEAIVECLAVLDMISEAIISRPNINLVPEEAKAAAWHKREFIIEQIASQLSNIEKFKLSVRLKKPEIMYYKIRKSLRWRFNSVKQQLQSFNKP
jgi:hypothetical protein